MQGYAVNEVVPSYEAWLNRVHPDDREEAVSLIMHAQTTRSTYINEFRILLPDGSIRWSSARGRFFYDNKGKPFRMIGVIEDITLHKQTEAKLRENETRMRKQKEAFQSAIDGATLIESLDIIAEMVVEETKGDAHVAFLSF